MGFARAQWYDINTGKNRWYHPGRSWLHTFSILFGLDFPWFSPMIYQWFATLPMGFFVALRRPTTWMSPPFTSMVIFTYVTSRDIHPREFEEKTGDKPKQKAYQLDIIEYMYNACVYVYCSKLYTDSIGDINMLLLFDTTLPCGMCESTIYYLSSESPARDRWFVQWSILSWSYCSQEAQSDPML